MPFVVTESCIQCKYTDCVTVCPMDCFFEGPNFLVIHPDECIDCSMCVPECPVGAIVAEHDVPPAQQSFIALNRELSRHPQWQRIAQKKAPLPDHQNWAAIADKRALLVLPADMAGAQQPTENGQAS